MTPDDVPFGGPWSDPGEVLRPFVAAIERSFCPFLEAASRVGVLSFHPYATDDLARHGNGDPVVGLFNVAVIHTERLRAERSRMLEGGDPRRAALACDNIVVSDSDVLDAEAARSLVDWPHYVLKARYSSCGLMFGKFWTGERDESLDGRPIPHPPLTFLSIRSAVKARDPLLLHNQPEFAQQIADGVDDGNDVLANLIGSTDKGLSSSLLLERRAFDRARTVLERQIAEATSQRARAEAPVV